MDRYYAEHSRRLDAMVEFGRGVQCGSFVKIEKLKTVDEYENFVKKIEDKSYRNDVVRLRSCSIYWGILAYE